MDHDPSNRDITRTLLAKTGFASIAEMSQSVMVATRASKNPWKQIFRPGVPAKILRFDNALIEGKDVPCVILEYLDGMKGEIFEYAHPLNRMFTELEFIPLSQCTMTYAKRTKVDKGM